MNYLGIERDLSIQRASAALCALGRLAAAPHHRDFDVPSGKLVLGASGYRGGCTDDDVDNECIFCFESAIIPPLPTRESGVSPSPVPPCPRPLPAMMGVGRAQTPCVSLPPFCLPKLSSGASRSASLVAHQLLLSGASGAHPAIRVQYTMVL